MQHFHRAEISDRYFYSSVWLVRPPSSAPLCAEVGRQAKQNIFFFLRCFSKEKIFFFCTCNIAVGRPTSEQHQCCRTNSPLEAAVHINPPCTQNNLPVKLGAEEVTYAKLWLYFIYLTCLWCLSEAVCSIAMVAERDTFQRLNRTWIELQWSSKDLQLGPVSTCNNRWPRTARCIWVHSLNVLLFFIYSSVLSAKFCWHKIYPCTKIEDQDLLQLPALLW